MSGKYKDLHITTDLLPRKSNGSVDWANSVGVVMPYSLDNVTSGSIKIVSVIKPNKVSISIDNRSPKIVIRDCILNSQMVKAIGLKARKFSYNVGDIVKTIEIIEQKIDENNNVAYRVRCLIDGYEYDITQSNLLQAIKRDSVRCPVCSNRVVIDGINSLADTNPELVEWFVDKELAHKISRYSNREVELECPHCHRRFYMKLHNINPVPSCICGDGFSYPEKMFSNVLEQLGVDYIYQLCKNNFEWCSSYKYDFYFVHCEESYIFELDGGLGHGNKDIKRRDSLAIDEVKDRLAKQNGVSLYRVDVNYPDVLGRFEYIKSNIYKSCLSYMFDLNIIDWDVVRMKSEKSLLVDICKDFDDGQTYIRELSDKHRVSVDTVRRYLKTGTKIGLCSYNPKRGFKNYMDNYFDHDNDPNKKIIKVLYKNSEYYINGINTAPNKIKNMFNINITTKTIFKHLANPNIKSRKGLTFSYATEEEIANLKEVI